MSNNIKALCNIADAIAVIKGAQLGIQRDHHKRGICTAVATSWMDLAIDNKRGRNHIRLHIEQALKHVRPTQYRTTPIGREMFAGAYGVSNYFNTPWGDMGYWWDRSDKMARLNALDRAMYWLTTQVPS